MLLEALLDSWDRNNTILVNLLRLIPESDLAAKATDTSSSVAELFMHIHYVRMVFLEEDFNEDIPEISAEIHHHEWLKVRNPSSIARMLNESALAVHGAVKAHIESGEPTALHYDHPILFLQHMIWHEGYHHGQIKLALKLTGRPLPDIESGPDTWGVWMEKTKKN
jgi:uncharacterized damage-inducible protein DinB